MKGDTLIHRNMASVKGKVDVHELMLRSRQPSNYHNHCDRGELTHATRTLLIQCVKEFWHRWMPRETSDRRPTALTPHRIVSWWKPSPVDSCGMRRCCQDSSTDWMPSILALYRAVVNCPEFSHAGWLPQIWWRNIV